MEKMAHLLMEKSTTEEIFLKPSLTNPVTQCLSCNVFEVLDVYVLWSTYCGFMLTNQTPGPPHHPVTVIIIISLSSALYKYSITLNQHPTQGLGPSLQKRSLISPANIPPIDLTDELITRAGSNRSTLSILGKSH